MRIDFAVIATLDEEFDAVKEVFQLQEKNLKSEKNFLYYYKKIKNFGIAFFKLTQRGNVNSASQTTEIINNFNPKHIILVGIAGGIKNNINLGDVAVSDNVEYYEYKKISTEKTQPRSTTIAPPSKNLRDIIQHVGEEWKDKIKTSRPDGKPKEETKVVHGLILSGETIQSGKLQIHQAYLEKNPIAFETEAGGVGEAIYNTNRSEYIVIKGISDYVDIVESQTLRDMWRKYASEVAAAFSYELILQAIKTLYPGVSEIGRKLNAYLEKVKEDFEKANPIDKKSLHDYYVESSFKLTTGETWNEEDEKVEGKEWRVEDFLKDDKRWRVVVGASFGQGKTSFVKYLANKLANLYNESEDSYFPIVIKLSELEDISSYFIHDQENLNSLVSKIIENESSSVLLILDGLDEYKGEIKDLFNYITELHNKYKKVKVIITSRLVKLPEEYINEYVRLMPFNKEKVNEFFKKYGVKLDYEKCINLGLSEKEITKPLFCWILGMISLDPSYKLTFKSEWSDNMKKSLLYYIFIHSLIRGKHKKEMEKFKDYYPIEKELLRYTAAIKNLYGELDEGKLRSKLVKMYKFDNPENFKKYLEPLITSYFYRSSQGMLMKIEFIHKSFEEYLLAEYYYESIKDGKMYRLNVGEPSEETMKFLEGLISMLKDKEAEKILSNSDESPFIKAEDKQKIIKNSKRIAENEAIIIKADEGEKEEEIWKEVYTSSISYKDLWLHRWIALSVFAWLHRDETIDKHKIENLIRLSSHLMPPHVKNLERIALIEANLTGANLFGANLTGANLERANLRRANLFGANLRRANLIGANLERADLIKADLTEADLIEANLIGANLERANLTGANLFGANLTGANLERANLRRANLFGANLRRANLIGANLERADLRRANLKGIRPRGILGKKKRNL
jgi:nucleoside phosphorylase